MTTTFHFGLLKDLSSILDEADDFNVIIQVGESHNSREFHAHSVILRARSPYFKRELSNNKMYNKENGTIVINKPDITPTIFGMILKYIYIGELDLVQQPGENVLGLLVASDELLLEELRKHVEDFLVEKKSIWIRQNFTLVLFSVFKLASCKKLRDHCLVSICRDPRPFVTSKIFLSLDKDFLFDLIKRDDFGIEEEIIIWDYLIKWGIEQTPGLGSDNDDKISLEDKDYGALKKTLESYVPLIRFMAITSQDFFDKIRPYKDIFPANMYEEIEEHYYKGTLPSTVNLRPRIIRSKFYKWINKIYVDGFQVNLPFGLGESNHRLKRIVYQFLFFVILILTLYGLFEYLRVWSRINKFSRPTTSLNARNQKASVVYS